MTLKVIGVEPEYSKCWFGRDNLNLELVTSQDSKHWAFQLIKTAYNELKDRGFESDYKSLLE